MEGLLRAPSESPEARIAFTEDFFRNLNLTHAEGALRDHGAAHFQCECFDERCSERVLLTEEEWGLVRAQGNRFAVAPDHAAERFEAVLTTHPTFWTIEKFGEAGAVAEELARLERAVSASATRRRVTRHGRIAQRHNARAGNRALRK